MQPTRSSPISRSSADRAPASNGLLPRLRRAEREMSPSSSHKRVDLLLVERGLFESRARARAAIEAGLVIAHDKTVEKTSHNISSAAVLPAHPAHPHVSPAAVH